MRVFGNSNYFARRDGRGEREMALLIPDDLGSLKRPALQKLCKSLGLKANRKNVEMVRLLEEYRERTSLAPQTTTTTSSNEEVVEKVKEERREEAIVEDKGEVESPVSEAESQEKAEEEKRECEIPPERCETDQSMTQNPSKLTNNPLIPDKEKQENQTQPTVQPSIPPQPSSPIRTRRVTFSVSPQPHNSLSLDNTVTMETNSPLVVTTPNGSSRKRRRTHSVSPSSSVLLQSGTFSLSRSSGEDTGGRGGEGGGGGIASDSGNGGGEGTSSTRDEIMALLEQRIADRKADPDYKSLEEEELAIECRPLLASKIPVSKTMEKMNKAHEKLFNKMPSILEYSEKKKKKRALAAQNTTTTPGPPAKKQRVAPKTPKTPYEPPKKMAKPSTASNSTAGRKTGGGLNGAQMIPNSQPNINFTGSVGITSSNRPTGKTMETGMFTFSAKPTGKQHIKKHKGKLPDFKFSIY